MRIYQHPICIYPISEKANALATEVMKLKIESDKKLQEFMEVTGAYADLKVFTYKFTLHTERYISLETDHDVHIRRLIQFQIGNSSEFREIL